MVSRRYTCIWGVKDLGIVGKLTHQNTAPRIRFGGSIYRGSLSGEWKRRISVPSNDGMEEGTLAVSIANRSQFRSQEDGVLE